MENEELGVEKEVRDGGGGWGRGKANEMDEKRSSWKTMWAWEGNWGGLSRQEGGVVCAKTWRRNPRG